MYVLFFSFSFLFPLSSIIIVIRSSELGFSAALSVDVSSEMGEFQSDVKTAAC